MSGDSKVVEKKGDLFAETDESTSLAHCVSVDLHMGKGIAVLFRDKFGRVNELKTQNPAVGGVVQLKCTSSAGAVRYIYYMITKKVYSDKPTYDSLRASLTAMKDHCVSSGVTRLAMPRIGCGLDGLEWSKVLPMITEVFQDSNVHVTIFYL